MDDSREAFEAFIAGSPFERAIERYPNDEKRFAWPGSYKDIAVDLAWQTWQAALAWKSEQEAK